MTSNESLLSDEGMNLLLRPKIVDALLYYKACPGATVMSSTYSTRITYSHMAKTVKSFEKEGILKVTRSGRDCQVRLTERGEKLTDHLQAIVGRQKKNEVVRR